MTTTRVTERGVGASHHCSVCLRAWDVGEGLNVFLLQQEGAPGLGGQGAHFNRMVRMKPVQLGQQRLSGLVTGGVGKQSPELSKSLKSPASALLSTQLALTFSGKGRDKEINTWMG